MDYSENKFSNSSWGEESSVVDKSWGTRENPSNTISLSTVYGGFSGDRFSNNSDKKFGGDRKRGCFNCGEEGHMSRDCSKPKKENRGGDRERKRKRGCYNCGEDGHMNRDCPNSKMASQSDKKIRGCFNCGEDGHMSRDCPRPKKEGRDRTRGCFNCGEDGHMSRDCHKPKKDSRQGADRTRGCFNCGEDGHMSR